MPTKTAFAALLVLAASISGVWAQDDVRRAMSNSIGLLTHCEGLGHIDADTARRVSEQTEVALKTALGALGLVDEEAKKAGEDGLWGSSAMPIADRAALFDQSVEDFCHELVEGF